MSNNDTSSNLPAYSRVVYGEIYDNLDKSTAMDSNFSAKLRTFFQYNRLVNAALHNIKINQSVLQLGLVFGDEIDQVAQSVGAYGQYDIFDINDLQISRNREKYGNVYPALHIFKQDAADFEVSTPYDVVLCFLLLQELPSATKSKVINNALKAVKPGGSVVFVDYHNPSYWHPLRYIVRMYNRLRNPFVEKLWDRGIETYAKNKTDFIWRKSLYFGGMFQRLVATRKTSPLEEALSAEQSSESNEFFLPDF